MLLAKVLSSLCICSKQTLETSIFISEEDFILFQCALQYAVRLLYCQVKMIVSLHNPLSDHKTPPAFLFSPIFSWCIQFSGHSNGKGTLENHFDTKTSLSCKKLKMDQYFFLPKLKKNKPALTMTFSVFIHKQPSPFPQ